MILKWRLMCFYFISVGGVVIYLKGFFPIKISRTGSSSMKDVPPAPSESDILSKLSSQEFDGYSYDPQFPSLPGIPSSLQYPQYTKLVLVIVNALREDFVFGPQHAADTPFLHKALLDGNGLGFVSRAQAPAVTLPRIKGLVTGSVPSYSDIILSLDQPKELREDNFIDSAFANSKSVVFYGDEIWTKMFPRKFKRQDPAKWDFMRDFKKVDNVVLDNLNKELTHPDNFDIMILDFLGLGHIGHIGGSKSPFVSEKLGEIDVSVKEIYDRLQENDAAKGGRSLLVVTGDHGMTDKGSHGGTTQHERDVPLLFLGPNVASNVTKSEKLEEVQQIDLIVTLSLLLGIPIPRNSMGQLIGPLLQKMLPANQLHALQYNCHHLLSLAGSTGLLNKNSFEVVDPIKLYRDALLSHATWLQHPSAEKKFSETKKLYDLCQSAVSDQLRYHVAAYNHAAMVFGMIITWCGYIAVIVTWGKIVLVDKSVSQNNENVPNSPLTWGVLATVGTMVHALSLLSSSFLEEEHQTWYYMTSTFLAILFLNVINELIGTKLGMADSMQKGMFTKRSRSIDSSTQYRTEKMELLRQAKSEDSIDSTWDFVELETSDDEYTYDRTIKKHSRFTLPDTDIVTLTVVIAALITHRFLRAWNSTGIQNADEPDIGDWLNQPGNIVYLCLSHILGLACVGLELEVLCKGHDVYRIGAVSFGLTTTLLFRYTFTSAVNGSATIFESFSAILTYMAIIFIIARGIFLLTRRRSLSSGSNVMDYIMSSVVLLSALLLRPHNIWVLVFNLFLYWSVFRKLWPIVNEDSNSNMQLGKIVLRTTLCYWFGQMAFFSSGNSNSLATIDVSAGYVGIPSHHSTLEDNIVRLLIIFATYTGPIIWTMLCLVDTVKVSSNEFPMAKQSSSRGLLAVFSTFAFLRLTPMAFYLILATAMRYHLFVWSVFAPKLLYETASTFIFGMMILAASIAAKWIK